MWRKCRSWVLLGPQFLISSIKMINCLEKVVDRVDLAEWVGSTGWRSWFYWMTESARWGDGVNSIGWCKRLRELKDITPRVPEDTFSAVVTRLSMFAEPSRQVCWLQSAALLSLVATLYSSRYFSHIIRKIRECLLFHFLRNTEAGFGDGANDGSDGIAIAAMRYG